MNEQLMRKIQRSSDSVWSLPERSSMTLRVGPGPRVLQALAGRLWLTSSGTGEEASLDVWLEAGESIELPHDLEVVLEGWPQARFQLLVPPSACRRAVASSGAEARSSGFGAWVRQRLSAIAIPTLLFSRY